MDTLTQVHIYLSESTDKLSVRPQSVDDIALAQKHWREIDSHREEMQIKSHVLLRLGSILSSHAPATTEDTTGVLITVRSLECRWTAFDDQMEAFSEMIVIQKASLKTRLEEQVMEQNQAIDKFIARWHALRPTELEHWDIKSVNKAVAELNESNLLCPFQVAHQVDYIGGRPS